MTNSINSMHSKWSEGSLIIPVHFYRLNALPLLATSKRNTGYNSIHGYSTGAFRDTKAVELEPSATHTEH